MTATTRVAEPIGLVATLILLPILGCQPGNPSGRPVASIDPPAGWSRWVGPPPTVPGRLLSAWKGPAGSSLVVYTALPSPEADPAAAGTDLANRLANLPGVSGVSRSGVEVDGRPGSRVEVVAPGDGASLAPSGLGVARLPSPAEPIPTRRVAVSVPARAATVWLVWHMPESERAALSAQVEATLATARVASPISGSSRPSGKSAN